MVMFEICPKQGFVVEMLLQPLLEQEPALPLSVPFLLGLPGGIGTRPPNEGTPHLIGARWTLPCSSLLPPLLVPFGHSQGQHGQDCLEAVVLQADPWLGRHGLL